MTVSNMEPKNLMDPQNIMNVMMNLQDDFVTYMILTLILILVILIIVYFINLTKLQTKECNYMTNLYGTLDGYIRPITSSDPDCSGNLYDYYIKTAYNACSGGSYKNDFVNTCNLINVIKQGVRCLDFEIYSIDNEPVVATSTVDNVYVKETYNSVPFSEVMTTIQNYAFSASTSPNSTDPLIIHLRFMSNNLPMYNNLANIFKSYDSIMLDKNFSYENNGQNIGMTPLTQLMNKVILFVDRSNLTFLESADLLEYINLTSGSAFMRTLRYYDVKNAAESIQELQDYNENGMTIVLPDAGADPPNPSGLLARETGAQMVAMRFQQIDTFLEENTTFFDNGGYAFVLKPLNLRYQATTIPAPTPQNPAYSYATRNQSTDYYNFNY